MNRYGEQTLVKIGVIGVGGAGGNAVSRMVQERQASEQDVFHGVLVMAANTDVQDLDRSGAEVKVQLGPNKTKGFGAGANPEVGREAAEESRVEIANNIDGLDMLFITAGMGGGTGTGAAPVIAEVAKSAGVLTVAVVTTPFSFEGAQRIRVAREGLDRLRAQVDAIVVIPNEKLVSLADDYATCDEMFRRSDEVLIRAVRSMADVVQHPATHHIDFADVRAVMCGMGEAVIGVGAAAGDNAALAAVREALGNPLLSDASIRGARRLLLHFTTPQRFTMREMTMACQFVSEQLHENPLFIWGIRYDETRDTVQALIVAEAVASGAPLQTPRARNVTSESQSLLFEMDAAKEPRTAAKKPAKPEVAEPPAPPVTAAPPREVETAAPAPRAAMAPASEAKGRFRDSDPVTAKVDLSERVLFQLPAQMNPADLEDLSVPAVVRQQMRAQRAKEATKQQEVPPLPEARVSSPHVDTLEQREAVKEMVLVSARGKSDNKHQ